MKREIGPQLRLPGARKNGKPWRQVGCILIAGCVLTAGLGWADEGVPAPPIDSGLIVPLHPVCVHFAIALIVFGLLLDCGGSLSGRRDWQQAGQIGFFAGVGAVGLAVISGWIEQQLPQPNSVFDHQVGELLFYHEYGGYVLLGFFIILLVARLQMRGPLPLLYIIVAGMGLIGLTLQGYWGGEMVYRYGAGVRAVQVLSETAAEASAKKSHQDDPQ